MNKKLKKMVLVLTSFLIISGVVMLFLPSLAFTASVVPTLVDPWHPSSGECAAAGAEGGCNQESKIDNWATVNPNGSHTFGANTITITTTSGGSGEWKSFNWTSTKLVCKVIVKAATGAFIYSYPGGSYGDTGLSGPENKGISHVTFCWDPVTTTTTLPGTTTTLPGTTTTLPGTTTTTPTTGPTTTDTTPTTTPTTTDTTPTTGPKAAGTIAVLALTGYSSLWYIVGSILVALGIVCGSMYLSVSLRRR